MAYRWEGNTGRTLTLDLKQWYLPRKGWPVSFAIEPGTRDAVNSILAQHVQRLPSIR